MFSDQQCEIYQGKVLPADLGGVSSKVTYHQFYQNLDPVIARFFSIKDQGFIYGTALGAVFCRNSSQANLVQDLKLIAFDNEKVKYIEIVRSEEVSGILAIGNQGTIMMHYKFVDDSTVHLQQFNIQAPIYSLDKIQDFNYVVSNGIGKVSMMSFKFNQREVELELLPFQGLNQVSALRILDRITLEVLCDNGEYQRVKFNPEATSVGNNPEAIHVLIQDALKELALGETSLKEMEREEQELNDKLVSVNQTLYAIQSIDIRRKKGLGNSLQDTGFEFTLCPVVKPASIANTCLQPVTYLRACIKTSMFLQLEHWELSLDLFPFEVSTKDAGMTQYVPVVGFETHYEQHMERYSVWERDIPLDLNRCSLPLKATCTLIMISSEQKELRFPLAEMIVDDIHFAIPCTSDLIESIERRGLDEVTNRLNQSYQLLTLLDKTNPFARLLRKHPDSLHQKLLNYKQSSIRCIVDPSMTNEQYRSILANLLSEGRRMDEIKNMICHAEQAYFTLASFPASPIMLKLTKLSINEIDIVIQCAHTPALFKAEATLLLRLYHYYFCKEKDKEMNDSFFKMIKLLDNQIEQLRELYHQDKMEIDCNDKTLFGSIKEAVDLISNVNNQVSIGFFFNYVVFPVTTIALVGTIIRSQARPAKAHSHYMKGDHQTRQGWKQTNDGLSVQDVGRSGGGV
ncbi:hypothetical protein BCV72DRAFT_302923 [Rhizopus microsporus var. microsporus]|uniref:Uncharacterized protein n=1 Tax=Rhizopus microsporus var. microsporus TaxID=86635 RepID=A0A1X0RBB8_RHIZD|nr:hypothetical protein BCV72DRAFT_302923 [Rhizopus microsporus var. microsporus]